MRIGGPIFALDLGQRAGFAVGRPGETPRSGTVVLKDKRPQSDLDMAGMSLPALQAAAVTMRWFVRHEQRLRDFLSATGAEPAPTLLCEERVS